MTTTADVQTLEPGGRVALYELDATMLGGDVIYFHGHQQSTPITWKGITYQPWPMKTEGFEITSDQPPTPKLTAGNVDGSLSALCQFYDDLLGAKLTVHETLVRYLDAVNFPDGNPTADPSQEFPLQIWFIERKSSEDRHQIEWELKSPMDIGAQQLPGRQIIRDRCSWVAIGGYRGPYCGYTGPPVMDINDEPTSDPSLDKCSGSITGCKGRFGANNPLSYGSFPAAGLVRS